MKSDTENIDIDTIDSDKYDVSAIETDIKYKNFSGNIEEYRFDNIIADSIINGQFSQARQQCDRWGFNYELMRDQVNRGEIKQ